MKPDQTFAGRADRAAFWEAWVGAVLSRAGLYTLHHPFTLTSETGKSNADYAHSFDLDVWVEPQNELSTEVEVKSLNLTFNNSLNYPYESLMVCSQSSWLKKWPGKDKVQRDFLFVSRATGAIVWLPVGSPVTMGHETVDSKRGETYKTVQAKSSDLKELCDFVEMVRG